MVKHLSNNEFGWSLSPVPRKSPLNSWIFIVIYSGFWLYLIVYTEVARGGPLGSEGDDTGERLAVDQLRED